MKLPDDLQRWLGEHFSAADAETARELLENAVDHNDAAASPRLLRCAAIGSAGNLEQLRNFVELMKIDYRDVIVAGEYEVRGGEWIRLRDLNDPIP